jgi:RimJ/RimL family protein N-acetyltransferase
MAIGHPPEAPVHATIVPVVADHSDYPTDLERDVTLKDGTALRLRPIRPDDAPRLIDLYNRLSRLTVYQRFFSVMKRLPPDWARLLATVDYHRRLALVAERGPADAPEIEAVARYEPTDDPGTVEVAFAIQDGYQGKGLGTALLRHLLDAAEARGIHRFRAYVLADNRRMLGLFSRLTHILERQIESGIVTLVFERCADEPRSP